MTYCRSLLVLTQALAIGLGIGRAPGAEMDVGALRAQLEPSVAEIRTETTDRDSGTIMKLVLGTGFLISSKGYVVTAAHVIADMPAATTTGGDIDTKHDFRIHVRFGPSHEDLIADVIKRDGDLDLAILAVRPAPAAQPLCFGDSAATTVESPLLALGYPEREGPHQLLTGEGRLKNISGFKGRWETSLQVSPGFSGGPVADASGRIVAVVWAGDQDPLSKYVTPFSFFRAYLDGFTAEDCGSSNTSTAKSVYSVPPADSGQGQSAAGVREVVAVIGTTLQVSSHIRLSKGCGQGPIPDMTIVRRPALGELTTKIGAVTATNIAFGNCPPGFSGEGRIVFYTARKKGNERFEYKMSVPGQRTANFTVHVTVQDSDNTPLANLSVEKPDATAESYNAHGYPRGAIRAGVEVLISTKYGAMSCVGGSTNTGKPRVCHWL